MIEFLADNFHVLAAILSAIISALAVYFAARAAGRANTKAKEIESVSAPYPAIAQHMERLQARLDAAETKNDTQRNLYDEVMVSDMNNRYFIRQLLQQWDTRKPLPEPIPHWVSEMYNLPYQYPDTPGSVLE